MRISCPGFARILDEEGRYALLLNKKRLAKGRRVFTPIGGALQLNTQEDMRYLIENFNARNFENGLDLRFQVNDGVEEAIKQWFHGDLRREMREISAAREVVEELTKEKLVNGRTILTPSDLVGVRESESFSHFCYHTAIKQDPSESYKGVFTTYIVEAYDFKLPPAIIAKMKRHPAVYFARESEIAKKKDPRTRHGDEIGDITKTILRNR